MAICKKATSKRAKSYIWLLRLMPSAKLKHYANKRDFVIILFRAGCLADPCSVNDICGANAECSNQGGRPTCNCLSGHKGDPYTGKKID